MKRSSTSDSDNTRFGRCDLSHSHKRPRYSKTTTTSHDNLTEDDADSSTNTKSTITSNNNNDFPQSKLWVVTSFLGKGSYGSVYLAKTTTLGQEQSLPREIAIKTVELSRASRLKNEARFLERLEGSPHIVSYYGHVFTDDKKDSDKTLYNSVLEYCEARCLEKQIKAHKGIGLGERVARKVAVNVLLGLKHIHGKNIIHGDIKPKNILHNGVCVKISGLGKAAEKGSKEYGEGWGHRRGTRRFMSPELMGDMVLDYCADVWAFGCTVLEMLTGEHVWGEHDDGELDDWEDWISLIGESGQVPYVPDNLSEEVKDFLSKCLERDPRKRWSVGSLLKHPFIAEEYVCPDEDQEVEDANQEAYVEEEEEVGDGYQEAYVEGEEYVEDIEAYLEEEVVVGEVYVEEEEAYAQDIEAYLEEAEEEDFDADIAAYLGYGQPFAQVEEAIEINGEYPNEDM
ncbi:unnamed protein product [Cochlearia groenlandica]